MIKLVATDMDGTLLDENSQVPPETFGLICQLKAQGVRFCVSSGRRYSTLRWFFAPVADEIDYVAALGGQVFADGRFLDREVFSTRGSFASSAPARHSMSSISCSMTGSIPSCSTTSRAM